MRFGRGTCEKTSKTSNESIFEAVLAIAFAKTATCLAKTATGVAKQAITIAKLAMPPNRSNMLDPRVGNQSGNGRPPVKRASQTYLLLLAPTEFERVTRAIMLQSNKSGKLQGLGQCVASWLSQKIDGEFSAARLVAEQHLDKPVDHTHQIYVALGPETTRLFKEWRTHLSTKSDSSITVTTAIGALVDRFLDGHDKKVLDISAEVNLP